MDKYYFWQREEDVEGRRFLEQELNDQQHLDELEAHEYRQRALLDHLEEMETFE